MSHFVLLDSNVWIASNLLRSAIGSSFVHALDGAGGLLLLPEIVEKEVAVNYRSMVEAHLRKTNDAIEKTGRLLGTRFDRLSPPSGLVENLAQMRFEELKSIIRRQQFSLHHASSSLDRTIQKVPPCAGSQQFKDAAIWETALEVAAEAPVYFVSLDSAFYKGKAPEGRMAESLKSEVDKLAHPVYLIPKVESYLEEFASPSASPAPEQVWTAIRDVFRWTIIEQFQGQGQTTSEARLLSLEAYLSEQPRRLAYAFECSVPVELFEPECDEPIIMTFKGEALVHVETFEITQLALRTATSFDSEGRKIMSHTYDPPTWRRGGKLSRLELMES